MDAPMPTVPTDNLYKFAALGGLATVLFLVWFFETRLEGLQSEQGKLSGEIRALDLQCIFLEEDTTNFLAQAKTFDQKWDKSLRDIHADTNHAGNLDKLQSLKVELQKHQAESQVASAEYHKKLRELKLKSAENDNKREMLSTTIRSTTRLWAIARVEQITVGIVTLWGFACWYTRVQIYQDRILRKEADERAPSIRKQKAAE